MDLLLPRTDAGVLAQAVVAVAILAFLHYRFRNANRDVRLFLVGLTVLTVALFGLRALH